MIHASQASGPAASRELGLYSATLPLDTIVLTLRGALPVQALTTGDRLVTRSGTTPLRKLHELGANLFALEFEKVEVVYVLEAA